MDECGTKCTADHGLLFLNSATAIITLLPHAIICAIVERRIFTLQNTLHWINPIAIPVSDGNGDGEPIQRGHYKPINSKRFLHDCHEYIFHLTRRGDVALDRLALGVPYADKSKSPGGLTPPAATNTAAGTHGLFRIARFRVAPPTGRIPRPSARTRGQLHQASREACAGSHGPFPRAW